MKLSDIVYPVFKLKNERPIVEDGVIFYYREQGEEGNITQHIRIVDDKNLSGSTLSRRRLQLTVSDEKLYKLHQAIFFLGDLIKVAENNPWFIDSEGKIFQYSKTEFCQVECFPVEKIIPIPSGGSIVELRGVPNRFKTLHTHTYEFKYGLVLTRKDRARILYGLCNEHQPTRRKKI